MKKILDYLQKHSERSDEDIAHGTGLSRLNIRQHLSKLIADGHVVTYQATRFMEGRKTAVTICRLVGRGSIAMPDKKANSTVVSSILYYLKKRGESHDTEISAAIGIPLNELHQQLIELEAKNQIRVCHTTRFEHGKKAELVICRLVGHGAAVKPAKKLKPQIGL